MMDVKATETVLEALAERIRELKTDILLKEAENEILRKKNEELNAKIAEIERKLWEDIDVQS